MKKFAILFLTITLICTQVGCAGKGAAKPEPQSGVSQEQQGTKVFCTVDTTYIVKNGEAFAFGAEDDDRFLPIVSNALKISSSGLDCYLDNDHNLHLTDSENREEVIDNVSNIVDDIGGDRRVFLKDSQVFYVDANDLGEFNNDHEPIRIEGLPDGEIVDIHSWYNKMYVLYAGGEVRVVEWPIKKKDGIKVSNPFEKVASFKAGLKNFVDGYHQLGFAIIDENNNLYFVEYDTNTVTLEVENVRDAFCGEASKYYILNDGSLWGCGWNKYGQLGVGDKQNREKYVKIMDGVKSITGGWTHVVVVTEDDRVLGFGNNFQGQLSGKSKMYMTPVEMKG